MKKIIIILILFLFFVTIHPLTLKASDNSFALTAISPDHKISKCLNLPQNSVLSALKENGFNPLQDATGFVYSLIDYSGLSSLNSKSRNAFWSFWIQENNSYQFSNLGPSFLRPEKEKSYVLYFSDGKTLPPLIKYSDICREPNNTTTINNKAARLNKQDNLADSLNYLSQNFSLQSEIDKDWGAIALGAFDQSRAIEPQDYDDVLGLSRHVLALRAQGKDARALIEKIKTFYNDEQFGDQELINDDIFAILAIADQNDDWLTNHQVVFNHIINSQSAEGSFGFSIEGTNDVDMTAAAIWALTKKQDYPADTIQRALTFLNKAQNPDGGFGYQIGQESNIASSSWSAIAFTAAKIDNPSVFQYLFSQKQESGHWLYGNEPSYKFTAYAVLALAEKSLPIVSKINNSPSSLNDSLNTPQSTQDKDGSDEGSPEISNPVYNQNPPKIHCVANASASTSASINDGQAFSSASSSASVNCY